MGYVVKNIDMLNELLESKKYNISNIAIDLPELTIEKNRLYSKKINKYYFACGCDTGTYFMAGAFLLVLSLFFFNLYFVEMELFKWITYSIIFVILSAIVGKLVGLFFSKIKLRKTIMRLKKEIS
jgi:uncharacterized integral membrane protein